MYHIIVPLLLQLWSAFLPKRSLIKCCIPGAKVHISTLRTQIICVDGKMFELNASSSATKHGLTDQAVRLMEHAKECLQRCKKLEACVTQLENETDNDTLFPIIVSRRPSSISSLKEKNVNETR